MDDLLDRAGLFGKLINLGLRTPLTEAIPRVVSCDFINNFYSKQLGSESHVLNGETGDHITGAKAAPCK